MKNEASKKSTAAISRREFVRNTAVASATAATLTACAGRIVGAVSGADTIRIGLIGCGGRGTGAAQDAVASSEGVEVVAMADLFQDRLEGSRNTLKDKLGKACKVSDRNCFVGFEAYKELIALDEVNYVILATPPHFRPIHLAEAIAAGKNVFMEKPVAVDPIGIRSVIASSEQAGEKTLGIVAGTQRRHQAPYIEIMKRIHDGAIGDLVAAQCYWNQGGLWVHDRQPSWSDMEWQCRNWLYFTWLSGDHIVEQHVHNLDVVNWAFQATPEKCMGMGGRQTRTEEKFGNIFDHFAIEYEFAKGVRTLSTCRQAPGASGRVAERIVGTKGVAYPNSHIEGENPYAFEGESPNPYVQEHADLIASIRAGEPLNEGKQVAESTLTAIMGRMSCYTGRDLQWDWVLGASKLNLAPDAYEFGDLEVRPVAIPGQTELI